MKVEVTPERLSALQALIDRSAATASPAVANSVGNPQRQMTAVELAAFWESTGVVAMATVGAGGRPHIAPVHATLRGTTLSLVIYDNTVRRRDLAQNPRVAFSTWGPGAAAVILYGRATEVPNSLREASTAGTGLPRQVVEIQVELTRVYAMRPRD